MRQYQEIYERMIDENKDLFKRFYAIHDAYTNNPHTNQTQFNQIGREIQEVVHAYERRLCGKTEGGMFSKFSTNLSEKFWNLVRKDFPKIDCVGILPTKT